MTDEELDRLLRESRPATAADDGWADTPAGDRTLRAIRNRAGGSRPRIPLPTLRRPRLVGLGVGLAAAAAAAVAVGLAGGPPADRSGDAVPPGQGENRSGPVPARAALVAYTGCDAMLTALRERTARHVGAYGFRDGPFYALDKVVRTPTLAALGAQKAGYGAPAPEHSTTNTQETGVREPDIVVTDGRRVVSVSGGVLRVVDAASRQLTGSLDLGLYAGANNAELLMSGDRVLVILNDDRAQVYYGGLANYAYPGAGGGSSGTTVLLVGLAGSAPSVLGNLHTEGRFVAARMVGDTTRLIVQSTPKLTFPVIRGRESTKQRIAGNRAAVRRAPLDAWLPSYQVSAGGATTKASVPCTAVSHPRRYTGESMLTVYTVRLGARLSDPEPISIAGSGANVYASTTSLYVADSHYIRHHGERTQLHRFDITGSAKPQYLGSNGVPGSLLDTYSMSEFAGTLRVAATQRGHRGVAETSVYVLDADTLKMDGSVAGLGRGEQVRAVRFLGPLGYVVTFKWVDPMFVVDLSNPAHPRRAGELRVPGYSDYLHPVGDGRLLGVGEDATRSGMVSGLQLSLFDVSSPADPSRLDKVVRDHTPSESRIDPHAFLFWPADRIAVVPIDSWNARQSGAAVVVRVADRRLTVVGTIRNPAESGVGYETGIERTLVIGSSLWTMSSSGLRVSDLRTLARRAWVPFG